MVIIKNRYEKKETTPYVKPQCAELTERFFEQRIAELSCTYIITKCPVVKHSIKVNREIKERLWKK